MRLGAGGRVEFGERRPGDRDLPTELHRALREWGSVASRLGADALPEQRDIVRRRGRQLAGRVSDVWGHPVEYHDPLTGGVDVVHGRSPGRAGGPLPVPEREPVPWGTGLVLAAFFALFAALADVTLSQAFGEAFGWLWVPANVLVVAGLAPSLWLLRRARPWRWMALGVAVGLAVAWLVLLPAALL